MHWTTTVRKSQAYLCPEATAVQKLCPIALAALHPSALPKVNQKFLFVGVIPTTICQQLKPEHIWPLWLTIFVSSSKQAILASTTSSSALGLSPNEFIYFAGSGVTRGEEGWKNLILHTNILKNLFRESPLLTCPLSTPLSQSASSKGNTTLACHHVPSAFYKCDLKVFVFLQISFATIQPSVSVKLCRHKCGRLQDSSRHALYNDHVREPPAHLLIILCLNGLWLSFSGHKSCATNESGVRSSPSGEDSFHLWRVTLQISQGKPSDILFSVNTDFVTLAGKCFEYVCSLPNQIKASATPISKRDHTIKKKEKVKTGNIIFSGLLPSTNYKLIIKALRNSIFSLRSKTKFETGSTDGGGNTPTTGTSVFIYLQTLFDAVQMSGRMELCVHECGTLQDSSRQALYIDHMKEPPAKLHRVCLIKTSHRSPQKSSLWKQYQVLLPEVKAAFFHSVANAQVRFSCTT
ncbi:hypothetical protein EGR_10627 [Echinococcus granulosus]|uniref:Uncharacterized protein n=1 Tax=Echinococcus granulosus TaxID=6210 RepID=W6U7Z8_ECHGR|nr:hypothetical protein EGR_10627 [Echinococcus granulosus]EUB54517.1 hypothetical protein EGR_10627 [Echinococcus granulosus]